MVKHSDVILRDTIANCVLDWIFVITTYSFAYKLLRGKTDRLLSSLYRILVFYLIIIVVQALVSTLMIFLIQLANDE